MTRTAIQQRLARLQRECEVSIAPMMLMAAACLGLVLMLAVSALAVEVAPVQAEQPIQPSKPSAA